MKNLNSLVSNRLRQLVAYKFGTQAALARALDVKPQTLTKYLSGEYLPGNTIQRKLRQLGVDVEYLMTGRHSKQGVHSLVIDPSAANAILQLLQEKLVVERKMDLPSIAARIGISTRALRMLVSGKQQLSLSILIQITQITQDLSFVAPLFAGSSIRLSLNPPEE